MDKILTGSEIRKGFIDFFVQKGHTEVSSAPLVPGGDQTLLFTNAGMVQFKDVFLGTDHRPYTRAVDSQKCMRVAGKHNDLDDVGRDDSHHTFFEMLGNWSFGDYYKKEAIAWSWELLTDVWGLDKNVLWTTCFQDEKGEIPADEEAFTAWKNQPGILPDHIQYFGRKENFWEMADTGPCGPCSEIHIDLGAGFCNKKDVAGHTCHVNGDCKRFLELWNLVFIQYNRIGPASLEPLPSTHVDTGMGLDRIVAVLQGVYSNYRTDLLLPLIEKVREMTGQTPEQREVDFTPYRVIADHARAATFLIADGVIPGNTGRNYVCRMIIRRASRFGGKLGLSRPFLARVAEMVINIYGVAYPELRRNQSAILANLTREEERFHRTLEDGVNQLEDMLLGIKSANGRILPGKHAFDLYATHGLPFEITRDIAREQAMEVDDKGFAEAMEEHRLVSGAGKAFGPMGGEDVDIYRSILEDLAVTGKLPSKGVKYDPYSQTELNGEVLAILRDGILIPQAELGDEVEILLPETCFYVESGGQVSDKGWVMSSQFPDWKIEVVDMRKPAAGVIVHVGSVIAGTVRTGDIAKAKVDLHRRHDIMMNHTATHLMHAELHRVLGAHARQAGSLVAPDRLRFDFTHPESLSNDQIDEIEKGVNRIIHENLPLEITSKSLSVAIEEGAMALFGEKYGDTVRTITIKDGQKNISYELCGGTHVSDTGEIGLFLITSEGSAAAGIRRIEAVTGRSAYDYVKHKLTLLRNTADLLSSSQEEVQEKTVTTLEELDQARKLVSRLKQVIVATEFSQFLSKVQTIGDVPVLSAVLTNADADTLRQMADRFREKYPSGIVVLGSAVEGRPVIIAAVTEDLVKRGIHAGELVKTISQVVGGSGGGKPTLAQAGGKDPNKLADAISQVKPFVEARLKK